MECVVRYGHILLILYRRNLQERDVAVLWSPAGRPRPPPGSAQSERQSLQYHKRWLKVLVVGWIYEGWIAAQCCWGWASGDAWPSMMRCQPGKQIFSPSPMWQREGKTGKVEYYQHNSERKSHVMQLLSQEIVCRGTTAKGPVQSPAGLLWEGDDKQRQTPSSRPGRIYLLDRTGQSQKAQSQPGLKSGVGGWPYQLLQTGQGGSGQRRGMRLLQWQESQPQPGE